MKIGNKGILPIEITLHILKDDYYQEICGKGQSGDICRSIPDCEHTVITVILSVPTTQFNT